MSFVARACVGLTASAFLVLTLLVVAVPAAAEGGSGGCIVVYRTCQVGVQLPGGTTRSGGSNGGTHGAPVEGRSQNPCDHLVTSPACVSQFGCETAAIGWFNANSPQAFDLTMLTAAQLGSLNSALARQGCPPLGAAAALPPPNPADVARLALASIVFPRPSGHRSPSESLRFKGYPFSWVSLWTYFWTDPGTWRTLSATATLRGVSATVTATPAELVFDPGDGSAAVSCAGPGHRWVDTDGSAAPADGCGFQYRSVTSAPITARQTIVWKIGWSGTGNSAGQLPQMRTSTSGQLQVMQIQVVNK